MSSYLNFRQNTSEQGSHLFNNLMSSCGEGNIITLKSVSSPDWSLRGDPIPDAHSRSDVSQIVCRRGRSRQTVTPLTLLRLRDGSLGRRLLGVMETDGVKGWTYTLR